MCGFLGQKMDGQLVMAWALIIELRQEKKYHTHSELEIQSFIE